MKKFENILWGIAFIIVGLILAGNAIGITNIDIFFDGWWTLFIIVPCFIGLFNDSDKTGNIIGLVIGGALLLACQGLLNFDMVLKLVVPVALVIIGVSIIFKDSIHGKINSEISKINKSQKDIPSYCATFSEQNAKFENEEFRGADLTAVFGGVKCDLRQAIINSDTVIKTESIFGGVEIYVPSNVKVKIKSTPIFGGVTDKSVHNQESEHTIYINSTCIFGGVDIK